MQHIAAVNKWTKFISMQNHYSLLYREEEREMIPYCESTGVGLIPWSPLARGHLARPVSGSAESARGTMEEGIRKNPLSGILTIYGIGSTETDKAIIGRVQEIAEKKGWSMATVALVWISGKVTAPIIGMGNIKRVEEAAEITGKKLEPEEIEYLEELYQALPVHGHS